MHECPNRKFGQSAHSENFMNNSVNSFGFYFRIEKKSFKLVQAFTFRFIQKFHSAHASDERSVFCVL